MKFLFRTDTHVADNSPQSWKGDYPAEIWSNLEQIGVLAQRHQVKAVLDGGDFFHIKSPVRNSHSLVIRTAEIHAQYPCAVYCIEGNHDITYNNLETIEKQPLGVLYATGLFKLLREEVFEEEGVRVRVVGVPYLRNRTLEELRAIKKKPGDDWLIAVVHALAGKSPPPSVEEYFGEAVFRYEDLVSSDGPDAWCFGHWHRDQGIEEIEGKFFVNQGAVSRGALIRENLERIPQVALIEMDKSLLRASTIPLVVAPASEVFDLDKKIRQEEEGRSIDQFVSRLLNDSNVDLSGDIEPVVRSMDFAIEVRELALKYLEMARAE